MGLFDFKKKKEPAVFQITEADLEARIAKAVNGNTPAPKAVTGMNAAELAALKQSCELLSAQDIYAECVEAQLSYLDASTLLLSRTAKEADDMVADFNDKNKSGGIAPVIDPIAKFTTISQGLESIIAASEDATGKKMTFKQATASLRKLQPELFDNPHYKAVN